jgi:four helix bundle protein
MRDHTKLKAFELADQMALEIYRLTKRFPKEELFGLTSQLRRAAVSAASNIVEGCARGSEADYIRFLDTAYASACEAQYQVSLAHRLHYLTDSDYRSVQETCDHASKVLGALIKALRQTPHR